SLDGHWTAESNATLEMLDAPGVFIPLNTNTHNEDWGNHISVERAAEKNKSTRLWMSIELPEDTRLEGKKVRVHMAMNVAFPVLEVNKHVFSVREKAIHHEEELELA